MPTTQVILVRHAEKASTPEDDEQRDLTPDGERRARYLGRTLEHLAHPLTAVFTSHHLRTRRTASVAMTEGHFSGITPVEAVVAAGDEEHRQERIDAMARSVADQIRGAARSNDLVLVVHHTSTLPAIARALFPRTTAPAQISEDDFRQLWVISLGERGEKEKIGRYPDPIPDA